MIHLTRLLVTLHLDGLYTMEKPDTTAILVDKFMEVK